MHMQQNKNCTKHNSEIIHVCINNIASLTPTTPPPTYKFEIDNYGKVNIAHRGRGRARFILRVWIIRK